VGERPLLQFPSLLLRASCPWRLACRTTLPTLREKPLKIGAKVVNHSNYVISQLAEVAMPRKLFVAILGRIALLRLACASG